MARLNHFSLIRNDQTSKFRANKFISIITFSFHKNISCTLTIYCNLLKSILILLPSHVAMFLTICQLIEKISFYCLVCPLMGFMNSEVS